MEIRKGGKKKCGGWEGKKDGKMSRGEEEERGKLVME